MNGWEWTGTAPGATGTGVSDDEDKARAAAEDWLRANPGGTAVLGPAWLDIDLRALWATWRPYGQRERSKRLPDGRITWVPVPASQQAGAA